MSDLLTETRELYINIYKINKNNIKEYLIISDFGDSSIKSEPGFIKKYFRIFTPVKSYKGRKLNSYYGQDFNPFKDTLMDYPTIVAYKLGKDKKLNWENYNRLISLHISRCPLNCWHCYVNECLRTSCKICTVKKYCNKKKVDKGIKEAWFTAKTIVDDFVTQRNLDRTNELSSNILRITGGEPFLVPELLLEILDELKSRKLNNEVFLWTETNLIPLIVQDNSEPIVSDELLKKLSAYHNFCVHPCFHGLSKKNFKEITQKNIGSIDILIKAMMRLIKTGIDIYPTFGSNMSTSKDVECFYTKISKIDRFLPLRFCLIEYDLDYEPVDWRRKNINGFAKKYEKVYDRFQIIKKWDSLLQKNTGYKYSELPRHSKLENMVNENKALLLFKWPSQVTYQERLLEVISLPVGARGEIYYNKKWLSDEISESDNLKIKTVFLIAAVDHTRTNNVSSYKFLYAIPFRLLEVRKIRVEYNEHFYFEYIAGKYLENINNKYTKEELTQIFKINKFPGQEKGFAHIVESQAISYQPDDSISIKEIFNVLSEVPKHQSSQFLIKDYPLIRISSINSKDETINPNSEGVFNLANNKIYEIKGEFYQNDNYNERDFYINNERLKGRSGTFKIEMGDKIIKSFKEKIFNLEVAFKDPLMNNYIIRLHVLLKQLWWQKCRWLFIILISLIGLGIVGYFTCQFPAQLFTALIIFYLTYFFFEKKHI